MPSLSQRSLDSVACVPGGHPPDHVDTHQRTLSDALSSQPSLLFVLEGALSTRLLPGGVQSYVRYRTVYVRAPTYAPCAMCSLLNIGLEPG